MIEEHDPEIKLKLFSSTANDMSLDGLKCTLVLKTLLFFRSWWRIKSKRLSWSLEKVIFEMPLILRQFVLDIASYDLSMKKLGLSKAKTLKTHAEVIPNAHPGINN